MYAFTLRCGYFSLGKSEIGFLNSIVFLYTVTKQINPRSFGSSCIKGWIRRIHVYPEPGREEGTLGISEWGCAAGTLEPLAYTRASSAEFC